MYVKEEEKKANEIRATTELIILTFLFAFNQSRLVRHSIRTHFSSATMNLIINRIFFFCVVCCLHFSLARPDENYRIKSIRLYESNEDAETIKKLRNLELIETVAPSGCGYDVSIITLSPNRNDESPRWRRGIRISISAENVLCFDHNKLIKIGIPVQ